jgi:two-component system sensor histidine kinase BarA
LQGSEESAKLVSMEQSSLLEQAVTLGDIIDPDSLQRVCMTFARTHKAGIAVLDAKGEVLVDVPAEHALCRRIAKQPGASLGCSFDHIVQTSRMLQRQSGPEDDLEAEAERPDGGPEQARCMCGLRYEMLPILHQDEVLGRLVFGPYRDPKLIDLPPELLTQLGDDDQVVEAVRADLLRIEARQPTQIRAAAAAINEVLSVIVQTGYARHLTSQIHIAAIQDAYNELSEKNRRLADSVEKLKDLDKLKSSFLATVSHELRTPLTSVIGYSEMLLEGLAGKLGEEQREYVKTILEKGDHLLQIINEILDVSRIESGTVQLSQETFNVGDLVRQVADAMMPQARQKDIGLTYSAEGLPPLSADRPKVRQVLLNLVSNAIKFTPAGGTVALSAVLGQLDCAGKRLRCVDLEVKDTGIGIPADAREQIFEAFYQVDSSSTREYGGTGLGLSIVKHFVEAHGGRVWVEDPEAEQSGIALHRQAPADPTGASAPGAEQPHRLSAARAIGVARARRGAALPRLLLGIAGDMFIGALVDLGLPWAALASQLQQLELPIPFALSLERREHHGISGADFQVTIGGDDSAVSEGYEALAQRYTRSDLPRGAVRRAERMLELMASAHARVVAQPVSSLRLVGAQLVDTAVDLLGAALALEALNPGQIVCRPIPVGQGDPHRRSRQPIPSPLALELLRDAPIWGGGAAPELCTPTGATIVSASVDSFGELPGGRLRAVGYGAGDVSLPDRPNHLRVMLLDVP